MKKININVSTIIYTELEMVKFVIDISNTDDLDLIDCCFNYISDYLQDAYKAGTITEYDGYNELGSMSNLKENLSLYLSSNENLIKIREEIESIAYRAVDECLENNDIKGFEVSFDSTKEIYSQHQVDQLTKISMRLAHMKPSYPRPSPYS